MREGISSSATEMEFTLEDAEQVLIYQEEGTPVIEGSVSITPVPGSAGFFLVRFPESADRNRVVRVRREVKPELAGYEKWKKIILRERMPIPLRTETRRGTASST